MRSRSVQIAAIASVLTLVGSGIAWGTNLDNTANPPTLAMNAGDDAHVTCAGPNLSWTNTGADSADLHCAALPSTTTTTGGSTTTTTGALPGTTTTVPPTTTTVAPTTVPGTTTSTAPPVQTECRTGSIPVDPLAPCDPLDGTLPPVMPTAVPLGFTRAFGDDFAIPTPTGQFDKVYGSKWGEYVGVVSTNGFTRYDSNRVLSVANGSLLYNLHTEAGVSYTAAPQPGPYLGMTYGQYGLAFKLDSTTGRGYKIAFLLWPTSGHWTNEVDFPEVDPDFTAPIRAVALNTTVDGGPHTFAGPLDTGVNFNDGRYHTFLLDWRPTQMTASIDGRVVATFPASAIPAQPMRVSLQAEGWINQGPVPAGTTDVLEVPWFYENRYTG